MNTGFALNNVDGFGEENGFVVLGKDRIAESDFFDLFCDSISRVMSTFSRRVSSGTSAGSGSKDLQAFSISCCKSETGSPNLK